MFLCKNNVKKLEKIDATLYHIYVSKGRFLVRLDIFYLIGLSTER